MASVWNLWVWLQCIGVATTTPTRLVGVVVRRYYNRYPHNNY